MVEEVKFFVFCVLNSNTGEYKVLAENLTKREAIEWIEKNKHKYPECEWLSFARHGFVPITTR